MADELVRRFLVHTGADLENTRSVRGIHFNAPVITHLEPDILEPEVKWPLESITTNKLVKVMEFQLS